MAKFESILMVVGLALLTVWGAHTVESAILSRGALAAFQAQECASPGFGDSAVSQRSSTEKIDFALWSAQRVKAYFDSLTTQPDIPIALLRIPAIHLEVAVFNGSDDAVLNRGVGRIRGTAQLGVEGNLGIAGHRDGFFRGLKDAKQGDLIQLVRPSQIDSYVINEIRIVDPSDVSVLAATRVPSVTLVTCFPFYVIGSAPQRFVVTAYLKDSSRPSASAAEASNFGRQSKHLTKGEIKQCH